MENTKQYHQAEVDQLRKQISRENEMHQDEVDSLCKRYRNEIE